MGESIIHKIMVYTKKQTIQKYIILVSTLLISFCIIFSGAMPKKYKVSLGDVSEYDITAPCEIQNSVKTKENRENAYNSELPDMKEDKATSIEVIRKIDEFLTIIKNEKNQLNIQVLNELSVFLDKAETLFRIISHQLFNNLGCIRNIFCIHFLFGIR